MLNINAGDLRHRITLNRVTTPGVADAVGQVAPVYQAVGTFYALVERVSGGEAANAKQLKGTLRYKITLRAASGPIDPSDQILWNGHVLGVVTAVTDPFNIRIEVDAVEKGTQ